MRQEGSGAVSPNDATKIWEKRGPIVYYIELGFELTALIIDFVHHLHMLLWSNIFLSMASLVICMQLRYLFQEIQDRYRKHRNYLLVRNHLEQKYSMPISWITKYLMQFLIVIRWLHLKSWRKIPIIVLFVGKKWNQQESYRVYICFISK